ncbi:hypothetical protein GOBAR_AA18000 [Gossypium barbadense]|uniref:Uncharacterized protein n=1 Tax=Gossypium barbadense TaxID=3634 RepID=A0A2P5XH31_GOSBA|nr:hypothetical protein GOBAR_AA18000 [Gossypium barbadense]
MTIPHGVTMEGLRGLKFGTVNVFEFPLLRTYGVTRDSWHKPRLKGRIQRDATRVQLVPLPEGCLLSIKDMALKTQDGLEIEMSTRYNKDLGGPIETDLMNSLTCEVKFITLNEFIS